MKRKIKKLLKKLNNKDGFFLTSIKIHSDGSGRVCDSSNIKIFDFSDLKQLKKRLKNLIK